MGVLLAPPDRDPFAFSLANNIIALQHHGHQNMTVFLYEMR